RYHYRRVQAAKNTVAAALFSTKLYWRCRRRAGFATAITLNQLPSNRAWSVAAVLPMPTTCALRSHQHLAARSATSLLSRFVADPPAKSIEGGMKQFGATAPGSPQRPPLASFG